MKHWILYNMKHWILLTCLGVFNTAVKAQNTVDFVLPSAVDSSSISSKSLRGGYVALHFLLKTECPYCIRHTYEYHSRASETPRMKHVFIKPDELGDILTWAKKLATKTEDLVPIYQDKGAQLAESLKIPGGYQFHNEMVHCPALIVLNTEEKEIFRYIGKDNNDRSPFDKLKEKVLKNEWK